MADENLKRDQNFVTVLGAITNDIDEEIKMLRVDPITKRLLVSATVTGGVVTSLNGLTGAITLSAGSNITLNTVGNDIEISSTGGGSSVSVNGVEVTDPDFVDSDTLEFDVDTSDVSGNVKGVNRIVVDASRTAVLGQYYISVATATYTDPTPVEGGGFSVLVRNGTSTIGDTAYSTAGIVVLRYFHSGAWANYVQMPQGAMSGDATQSVTGAVTIANDAVSNAKLANMAANTIKARITAGTGDPEDATPDQINKILDAGPSVVDVKFLYDNATSTDIFIIPSQIGTSVMSTGSYVANTIYLLPWFVTGECNVERLAINVTTGGTATALRFGIWECNADGEPETLVYANVGALNFTGTGVKELTGLSEILPAGRYYLGVILNGTATLRSIQFSQPLGVSSGFGTSFQRHLQYSFTFGALGNLTPASLTFSAGSQPAIGVGLQ